MVSDSEEEEEKTRLLCDSATSSQTKQDDLTENSLYFAAHCEVVKSQARSSLTSKSELMSTIGCSRNKPIFLRQSEEEVPEMSCTQAFSSGQTSKESSPLSDNICDTVVQVPDSLQVVKDILSELENEEDISSEIDGDDNHSRELNFRTSPQSRRKIGPGTEDNSRECTCDNQFNNLSNYPGTTSSLVVDVHQDGCAPEVEVRCSKHTSERFPRCYSESHRARDYHRDNNKLINLDKIETFGEDRVRHFSESAVASNKRTRAATFSNEIKQLRKSIFLDKSLNLQENEGDVESPAVCCSQDSILSDVKFEIWDGMASDQNSEFGDTNSCRQINECDLDLEALPHPLVTSLRNGVCFPVSMSQSSSTSSMPICRICQLPSIEPYNPLISPCRCLGSIRYIHKPCLMKWLEVSSKKNSNPPGCELCQYKYIRHKKLVISNWLVPSCSSKDKVLHSVFMAAIAIMITCSIITILSFKQNGDIPPRVGPDTELSPSELMTLSFGVLFFFAFFVAMYVEVKAENTIYQLICKFFYINHEWTIEEYDPRRDAAKQVGSL